MTLQEYVALAKQEIDEFEKMWVDNNKNAPNDWPMDFDLPEWGEQELAYRFQ